MRSALLLFLGDPKFDRRVESFVRWFRENGFEVRLLAGVQATTGDGYDAVQLKETSGPKRFWEYDRKLAAAIKNRKAEVVMACDLYSLRAAAKMRAAGKAQFLIYDAREVYTELPTVAHRPFVKQVWKRVERRGLAVSDHIVVTAPDDLNAILEIHGFVPRSTLVRNMPWLGPQKVGERQELRKWGIDVGDKVCVYIGGLQTGRGLKQSIEAIRGQPEHLLLIGDGSLRTELEQQASGLPNVHFAGALSTTEALRIASVCDEGLSLIEPISKSYELALPSKLFEYMSIGLPIVSSKLKPVADLFANAEWLTFVDDFTPASIRCGIEAAFATSANAKVRELEIENFRLTYNFAADAKNLLPVLDSALTT